MLKLSYQPRRSYDVVVVGAGVHGLATAYYLARQGVRNVGVLDKGYLGAGNSGRNTAILRSNYRTAEGIPFYQESLTLYEELSATLGWNVLFSQQGHLTLAHTDSALNGLRVRAEANQALGVDSKIVGPREIKEMVPEIDISDRPRYPIVAALYHPPGGIIRHDAVVWGYAREAAKLGVDILPRTEVTGIERSNSRILAVQTSRGIIATENVVNATSGWCTAVSRMADVPLPIVSHPLQACVSERKPERARRSRDGRGNRSVPNLLHAVDAADARNDRLAHPGTFPPPAARAPAAPMERHLRHDARLQPHHQRRAGIARLLSGRRLGHLRV
jgi:sarcosine oxidase subunit beta